MKVKVQTCCGCCDLHTGTLIVGICGIIFSAGGIVTHTTGLDESFGDERTKTQINTGIGYSYINIIINILLIYGAIKESRYFLLPWLIYDAVGLGVVSLLSLYLMFLVPAVIILVPIWGALWYVWFCVLCYYQELNPTNPPPANVYSGVAQITSTEPTTITYVHQPPMYMETEKGHQIV